MRVLMIGPDDSVKGGMTTVQQVYRAHWHHEACDLRYIGVYCAGKKLKKLRVAVRALVIFISVIVRWHPDVVHVHFSWYAGFYRESVFMLLAKILRQHTVIHAHAPDFPGFYSHQPLLCRMYIRAVMNQADDFIALTEPLRAYFQVLAPQPVHHVLPNPVMIPHDVPSERDQPVILTMGQLGQRKGTYDLLAAIPAVLAHSPQAVFWLAGDGEIDRVQEQIKRDGMANRVHLMGWVTGSAKDDLLRRAMIFVLPSYHEAQSMAVLEAMAYGLPVVTTPAGGLAIMSLTDSSVGVMIPAGDSDALAEAIITLLSDPARRAAMGESARKHIRSHFTVDAILEQLYEIYRDSTA